MKTLGKILLVIIILIVGILAIFWPSDREMAENGLDMLPGMSLKEATEFHQAILDAGFKCQKLGSIRAIVATQYSGKFGVFCNTNDGIMVRSWAYEITITIDPIRHTTTYRVKQLPND